MSWLELGPGSMIPIFELSNRFCYFLDLQAKDETGNIAEQKRKTFDQATSQLVNKVSNVLAINSANKQNDTIENAINFLNLVAKSERNKELKVIKTYKDQLIKEYKEVLGDNKDFDKILQELEDFSNQPKGKDIKSFYTKLTSLLNITRQNVDYYKQRIEELSGTEERTWKDIAGENVSFRLGQDIDTLLKSLQGIQQRQINKSFSTLLIKKLMEYISKHLSVNSFFFESPIEVIISVMIDFETFIEPYYKELMSITDKKEFEKEFYKYWDQYEENETQYIQKLKQETKEALTILNTIRSQTGLKIIKKSDTKEYEERLALIEKADKSKTRDRRNIAQKILADNLDYLYDPKEMRFLQWTTTTGKNGQHGLVYELQELFKSNGQKIMSQAGTDVIVLDLGKVNLSVKAQKQIDKQKLKIAKELKANGEIAQKRRSRLTDLSESYKKSNANLRDITSKLNEILKKNKIEQDIFIYHESLKLYATAEEHKSGYFEGRNLNILNALDNLYSANNLSSSFQLMDQELMYNIVLNLSKYAVGGKITNLVENYLSIFAGLLMFDDIQNIAYDAANNAISEIEGQGQAYTIHLYLLNDVYVPGSMILTSIAKALEEGYTKISSSDGAKVSINTSGADSLIQSYLQERKSGKREYHLKDWRMIGNEVPGGTKLKIIFLTSFLKFIQDIQKSMQ